MTIQSTIRAYAEMALKSAKGKAIMWRALTDDNQNVYYLTFNNRDKELALQSTQYAFEWEAEQKAREWLKSQPVKTPPKGFNYLCNNPRTIPTEKNDCVVRALSLAFNVDYSKVHEMCASAGRKPRSGMLRKQTDAVIKQLAGKPSAEMDKLPRGRRQTFTTFARENPKGKWVVIKSGHAVALIDGVYHDNGTAIGLPRAIVQCYYRAN